MKSNFRRLGDLVKRIDLRNSNMELYPLKGVSISKEFIDSVANVNGTDLKKYKIVKNKQYVANLMHVDRDRIVPISMWNEETNIIVSPAYDVFELNNRVEMEPEYLMLCFNMNTFDKNAWFLSGSSIRGNLSWENFCNIKIPVPKIEIQKEIIRKIKIYETYIAKYKNQNYILGELSKLIFTNVYSKTKTQFVQLSEIVSILYGKGLPISRLTNSGFYVYGGNGIIGKYNRFLFEDSVNIVSCRGEKSGNNYITHRKSYITSNSLVLLSKNDKKHQYFLKGLLDYTDLTKSVTGSAQPQITIQNIERLSVEVPLEQNIIQSLNRYLKPIWNKKLFNESILLFLQDNFTNFINFNILGVDL